MSDTDLQARLQAALRSSYRIERELGGGGMSRVFLAEETALGRKVVVKVLPPDMAAGVNVERFRREIQLAASLQHPHIVPLYAAGQAGDLFYYTMPVVEGESLRAKLAREGQLPVDQAVRLLRDVVDALAYAHAHGVVHRDIKPDNILISNEHAVVTDFGVAKAVSAASRGSTLTSLGVALGTPAYMAPEQAAADPHVDHRADIYAAGVMGYEMLTGRLPFNAPTPQAMLAAHVTQVVEPPAKYRPAVPPALNALVMRCLEKMPADRVQRAEELRAQLEAMATPSGGMAPTGAVPISSGTEAAIRRAHPVRVAAAFGAGSLGVLALVYLLMLKLGLPDWVFAAAVALLVVGLPIMLVTGVFERRRALASTTGAATPTPQGIRRWFTWRRSLFGGAAAFSVLGIATAVYMAMRLLGIGPVGTLVASGVLKQREPLIVAAFENRTPDSTLGAALVEAFRIDLSQSPTVKVVDPAAVAEALQRMQRRRDAPLDAGLAREIAEREGIKAVVTGEIDPVGRGYVLSASLVASADGRVLAGVRETAESDAGLIGAIDRLSRKLRERIGESLTTIRANEPLEQVTTASLEALRKYSQADRAEGVQGDYEGAVTLLREAIALDTSFAMAYRKLAVVLGNSDASREQIVAAARQAYEHRDRLPDLERDLATAYYYSDVEYDRGQVIRAYRSALERYPDNTIALNNLALALNVMRRPHEAESLAVRATFLGNSWPFFFNAAIAQSAQGRYADARATIDRLARVASGSPKVREGQALLAAAQGDYATAERQISQLRDEQRTSPYWQALTSEYLAQFSEVRGRIAQSEQHLGDRMSESEQRGLPGDYLVAAVGGAWLDLRYRNRAADGLKKIASALARHPLTSIAAADRPYLQLARYYAQAGRVDEAKRLVAEFERTVPEGMRRGESLRHAAAGDIALADGRLPDAIAAYRAWHDEHEFGCATCGWFEVAEAYDRARQPDSARTVYERVVSTPGMFRIGDDANTLAPTYKRLGELYEARHDRAKAAEHYGKFLDLWKGADADLQPYVTQVRAALKRASGEPGQ